MINAIKTYQFQKYLQLGLQGRQQKFQAFSKLYLFFFFAVAVHCLIMNDSHPHVQLSSATSLGLSLWFSSSGLAAVTGNAIILWLFYQKRASTPNFQPIPSLIIRSRPFSWPCYNSFMDLCHILVPS